MTKFIKAIVWIFIISVATIAIGALVANSIMYFEFLNPIGETIYMIFYVLVFVAIYTGLISFLILLMSFIAKFFKNRRRGQ
jgi:hypothetical protein